MSAASAPKSPKSPKSPKTAKAEKKRAAKGAKAPRRWVIKAGSNMVCTGGPILVRDWMRQLATLRREHGIEVVWVTSGAIASAVDRTGFNKRNRALDEKQALASIGQPIVMELYNLALQSIGLMGGQILLTYDDLGSDERRQNFQNTVEKLLEWGVVPVLNENDAVATQEIRFGDNDSLSAKVAGVIGADRLLILTDVEGLYDADPRTVPGARLVGYLPEITPAIMESLAPGGGTSRGTGGMYSKIKAAAEATERGIETWLVKGDLPHILVQVAEDKPVGTRVRARKTAPAAGAPRIG